jgi:hypothetical protein
VAKDDALTRNQLEWLETIARPHIGVRNWAGCPYGTFAALIRKGFVKHTPNRPGQEGFSQWDTFEVTTAGEAAIAAAFPGRNSA